MRRLLLAAAFLFATAANGQTLVLPANGGTGIKNSNTATLTRSGAHALTITTTGTTGVTLPTSGTVVVQGGAGGTPSSLTLTNATGLPVSTGLAGAGTGVPAALGVNTGAAGAFGVRIAGGTSALATGAIASGACATAVTTGATGTATTDVIGWGFNGDPTGVTGYAASANGMLTIIAYPSANNVNYKVCNNTAASITPGAITLNWIVLR